MHHQALSKEAHTLNLVLCLLSKGLLNCDILVNVSAFENLVHLLADFVTL